MTRYAPLFVLLASLMGCARNSEPTSAVATSHAPDQAAGAARIDRFLAYEHSINIQSDDDQVAVLSDSAQAACREASAESCVILEARVSSGEAPFASLKFRAKAAGITKLIAVLSAKGKVLNQSTSAEDLAAPIEDAAKKLAMLQSYREQLEALSKRGNNDMDTLIKLSRELAQVQSDIEALSGTQAQLVQRVETEILNVSIGSYSSGSFWRPIAEAATDLRGHLGEGFATAITALAFLLPWGLLTLFGVWVFRKLRKRRTSKLA